MQIPLCTVVLTCPTKLAAFTVMLFRTRMEANGCTERSAKQPTTYAIKKNSVALVRERTLPTELPPPVGEVSANFCG